MILPGDRVFIPQFTDKNRPYWAVSAMDRYSGREATITRVAGNLIGHPGPDGLCWYIAEDGAQYYWAESWLVNLSDGEDIDLSSEPDIMSLLGVV